MKAQRGDVVLTRIPHAAGGRGKKRPAVVVQANVYNLSQRFVIVAEVTSNLIAAADPANLLIDITTPDGQLTGLVQNCVITCLQLATISEDRMTKQIGQLSSTLLRRLDDCLKAALELP